MNDYHPLDKDKPSIPADIKAGDKVFGPVVAAAVTAVENAGANLWSCTLNTGDSSAVVVTSCQNIHVGRHGRVQHEDESICTLDDLHAQQTEFPHCIPDGIFVLHEDWHKAR